MNLEPPFQSSTVFGVLSLNRRGVIPQLRCEGQQLGGCSGNRMSKSYSNKFWKCIVFVPGSVVLSMCKV